jgi:arylsulfatase A-like enzyme
MRYVFLFFCLAFADCIAQQRPNIIYIMNDERGGQAISAYNKRFIQTPNIDRLANEGMRFDKAHRTKSITPSK